MSSLPTPHELAHKVYTQWANSARGDVSYLMTLNAVLRDRDLIVTIVDQTIADEMRRFKNDAPTASAVVAALCEVRALLRPKETPVDEETWIRETAEQIVAEDAHISELFACLNILRERVPLLRQEGK